MTEKLLKKEELFLLEKIKEIAPDCVNEDGKLDIRRLAKKMPVGTVFEDEERTDFNFLGKNYARMLASVETETVIVPDTEHNSKPENANSQNIYISGDNLDALKHLLKSYEGKVKCIYIDPPYNTGSDGFVYNDTFNYTSTELAEKLGVSEEKAKKILNMTTRGSSSDSAWLTFMLSRLLLAKDMLTEDGVIFISIDDNEQANLKLLCDDVFGNENFICDIIWNSTKSVTNTALVSVSHTYNLVYAKEKSYYISHRNDFRFKEDGSGFSNPDNDPRGPWKPDPFQVGGWRPNQQYEIINPTTGQIYKPNPKCSWKNDYEKFQELQKENRIVFGANGTAGPQRKRFLYEAMERGKVSTTLWKEKTSDESLISLWDDIETTTNGTQLLINLLGGSYFDNPKPVSLIKRISELSTRNEDIVLDFFSGSATTAHAVMQLNAEECGNRQFIMVQLPENLDVSLQNAGKDDKGKIQEVIDFLDSIGRPHTLDQIGIERIERAAQKIRKEHPDTTADLGFKHFTLKAMPKDRLENLEKFDPNAVVLNDNNLNTFGAETLLTTWMERDGYGMTSSAEQIDFDGYKGYRIGTHLYLLHSGLTNSAVKAIVEKYNSCPDFGKIQNIVLFEYGFSYGEVGALKRNLISVGSKLGIAFNFEKRC